MLEFVMVIPLIALVIAATFFFGWGLRNRMGMKMTDRFISWTNVRKAPLPERYGPTWHDVVMDYLLERRTVGHIYYSYFDKHDDTFQTLHDLTNYVGDYSPMAAPVAQELLLDRWPLGSGFQIRATFPTPVGPWENVSGLFKSHYIRDGVEWRRGEASQEEELTDEFQRELDDVLKFVPGPGDDLADRLRGLYLEQW